MRTPTLAVLAAVLAPLLALAQGGPGRGPPPDRLYDVATVTSVSGTVASEQRQDRGRGHRGVHLSLDTPAGALDVHLGPDFFVDGQPLKLAVGDQVTVTGSKVTFEGAPALVARSVSRGAETLVLRDEAGRPRWSGPRGR